MKKPLHALFTVLALLALDAVAWLALWWVLQKLRSLVCLLFVMCAAVWLGHGGASARGG